MPYLGRQPNTGVRSRYIYTATASQTTFTGSDDDGKTLKYEDAAYVDVFLNGVLLKPVTDYAATTKTSVVLTSAAAASDILEIVAYDIANIANTVSATNGGTFEGNVNFTDNVKAIFGDGSDLQIYHDGSNSFIKDSGTGNLLIQGSTDIVLEDTAGSNFFRGVSGSYVRLYHNNSTKLETTSTGIDITGTVTADGLTVDGTLVNRTSSDGDIAVFYKDTTTVGSIGAISSRIYIGSSDTTIRFKYGAGDAVVPANGSGALRDNAMDVGASAARWDDIYATNSVIQTSDANEKQDVAELDEAEKRVATAAKGLIRKFRWIDSVEEKGDDARIHVGIIAQDLKAAFEAEGLDPGRYAMFISSTWWEADETYTDDEGVEQTRTNTYQTAEEAPVGAVERTRLGVRYNQLLAFIIGAM